MRTKTRKLQHFFGLCAILGIVAFSMWISFGLQASLGG